ncbi:TetR/AcrR family transcriptional regulator [Agromyces humatus]|uniref:TetR/AcrR family transcriptional regulator n=1 Tax=Agromyces humatus TaxID=279573 RepID=A0ABN2KSF5_9MICO|nr:TetR/AcrR family transcriptional regulator [Agromyces humatus]
MTTTGLHGKRGRPREFDVDEALDRVIEVFWRHGYDGTTLDDLTAATGVNRPSLYAAFGHKEQIFEHALDRYARVDMAYVGEAIAQPTAAAVARHYLHENVFAITAPDRPRGCLSIQAGLAGRTADQGVVKLLRDKRAEGESALAARLSRAIHEGDLADAEDPRDLARFLSTVSAGLAVQAAAGASTADLMRVADRALSAFPIGGLGGPAA